MQTNCLFDVAIIVCCVTLGLSDVNLIRNTEPTLCYDKIDKPYIQFATKTGYRVNQNKDDDEIKVKGIFFIINFF